MKSKTSLWLIYKTCASLKFGSSCIIIAHFSSCPFFPCQAFQAGFPYAPVKTGNCFKRLKHLYFSFFSSPNCLRMFVFKKKKSSRSQPSSEEGSAKASYRLRVRSSPWVCAALIFSTPGNSECPITTLHKVSVESNRQGLGKDKDVFRTA